MRANGGGGRGERRGGGGEKRGGRRREKGGRGREKGGGGERRGRGVGEGLEREVKWQLQFLPLAFIELGHLLSYLLKKRRSI